MISPLKSYSLNTSFKSLKQTTNNNNESLQNSSKKGIKEGVIGLLKNINNVKNTTDGFLKGTLEGGATVGIIGLVGKSIKDADGKIVGSMGNIIKTSAKTAWSAIKFIPAIIKDKTPLETVQTVLKQPKNFYQNFMKDNKLSATIATLAGAGVLEFRTIQGKMHANKSNAEIDHYTTSGGHK